MKFRTSVLKRSSREKIVKRKDGSSGTVIARGGWFYRVRYVDLDGKPRTIERGPFDLKRAAQDALQSHLRDLRSTRGRSNEAEGMTFAELAKICEDTLFREAEFVVNEDGNRERVRGLKSWQSVRYHIANLTEFFKGRLINRMTTESLAEYKAYRRKMTRTMKDGSKRHISIATVNRELAALRRMLRLAKSRGWITDDVFSAGGIIEIAKERKRTRILSLTEEEALLSACSGSHKVTYERTRKGITQTLAVTREVDNKHLRAILMLAIDSGMRRSEILSLRWKDIDFEAGLIKVISQHTKTDEERIVPLSDRCKVELLEIRLSTSERATGPFPFNSIKRSFETAKDRAGISDLRFHDLRSTAATRMSRVYPVGVVAKILGHADVKTTMQYYVSNEVETILEVKAWLDGTSANTRVSDITELVN